MLNYSYPGTKIKKAKRSTLEEESINDIESGEEVMWSLVLKGALSRGFCCFQLHSLLKSLPCTFIRPQNAPDRLTGTYQTNGGSESKP